MHIVKPLQPGLLHRGFSYRGQALFAVSVLIGFRLGSGEYVLEQELWQALGKYLGKSAVLDGGIPKARAEVLMYGAFHAPGGQPVRAGKVSVQVGAWHKQLAVFGDRHWRPGIGPSEPEPMTSMPIDYAHAFGGADEPRNPIGLGLPGAGDSRPLPNIEAPTRLIGSPADRPAPAGLGPLDQTWAPRAGKRGTYDERWLKERAPGLADDIDWSFFNEAPADQWLETPLEGGEPIVIEHMHPRHARLAGTLPTAYGRAFVELPRADGAVFEEIPLTLDTLWLLPEDELGIMIWRGSVGVASEDPAEVAKLLIAFEERGADPRPPAHYREEMRKRTDPDEAYRYLLYTAPLIPEGVRCGFEQIQADTGQPVLEMHGRRNADAKAAGALEEAEAALARARADTEAQLKAAGVDPAPRLAQFDTRPAEDADMAALQALIQQAIPVDEQGRLELSRLDLKPLEAIALECDRLAADKRAAARAMVEAQLADLQRQTDHEGQPFMSAEEAARIAARFDAKPPLPRPIGDEMLEELQRQLREAQAQIDYLRAHKLTEAELPELESMVSLTELQARIDDANRRIMDSYRLGAHLIEGTPPHHGRESEVAATLLAGYARKASLAGGDFAAVNLAGRALAGIDLREALLEDVDLSGADLSGATLERAVLARANLSGTNLRGANLRGANLGGSDLTDADLRGADLEGAVLSRCQLTRSRFQGAALAQVQLLETRYADTDFSDADLSGLNFIEADLRGCCFERARLSQASFIKPQLAGASFARAQAAESTFIEPRAAGVSFAGADLSNARFLGGADLAGADFSGARLERANLAGAGLAGADFSEAQLKMAYFGDAQLQNARLTGAQGERAAFTKADLSGADLHRANLMEASFHQARLVGARFNGGNLYAADFMKSTLGETLFHAANLDRSLLRDWRPS